MFRDRLEIQIDVLEQVEALNRQFNMGAWFEKARDAEPCRTAACAFGYAALDPRLQEMGLHLRVAYTDKDGSPQYRIVRSNADYSALHREVGSASVGAAQPVFGGDEAFGAAMEFYGISGNAADYLFDPTNYSQDTSNIAPRDVITRIREVIDLDGEAPEEFAHDVLDIEDDEEDC